MYRVIYKGYSGDYQMSDEMTLGDARKFKEKCLEMQYPEENIHIIQIIEWVKDEKINLNFGIIVLKK